MADLGHIGNKVYVKNYGGKSHVIIKGYAGPRKILTGTKYGVQNAKVVEIGLGKFGAVNAKKSGGLLTICRVTTLTQFTNIIRISIINKG